MRQLTKRTSIRVSIHHHFRLVQIPRRASMIRRVFPGHAGTTPLEVIFPEGEASRVDDHKFTVLRRQVVPSERLQTGRGGSSQGSSTGPRDTGMCETSSSFGGRPDNIINLITYPKSKQVWVLIRNAITDNGCATERMAYKGDALITLNPITMPN